MKTAKFNKEIFQVKETGRVIYSPAKSYYDFNGYYTEKESTYRKQYALYDETGLKRYTLDGDGTSIRSNGQKIGSVKVIEDNL